MTEGEVGVCERQHGEYGGEGDEKKRLPVKV